MAKSYLVGLQERNALGAHTQRYTLVYKDNMPYVTRNEAEAVAYRDVLQKQHPDEKYDVLPADTQHDETLVEVETYPGETNGVSADGRVPAA